MNYADFLWDKYCNGAREKRPPKLQKLRESVMELEKEIGSAMPKELRHLWNRYFGLLCKMEIEQEKNAFLYAWQSAFVIYTLHKSMENPIEFPDTD